MAVGLDWEREVDRMSPREAVLLNEVLRIEAELHMNRSLGTSVEREAYELLLDELQLVMERLSPEDETIWSHILRIASWLREETLARSKSGQYSYESLLDQAQQSVGRPLTSEEKTHLQELATELEEVDRLLSD